MALETPNPNFAATGLPPLFYDSDISQCADFIHSLDVYVSFTMQQLFRFRHPYFYYRVVL